VATSGPNRATLDLMSTAVVNGEVTLQQAFDLMILMSDKGRSLRLPRSASEIG
jgi:hypothetical protein